MVLRLLERWGKGVMPAISLAHEGVGTQCRKFSVMGVYSGFSLFEQGC